MEILTDPNNYDVCISISALVLMAVIIVIHLVGEFSYGKQSRIFGGLIIVATLLNVMGLIHVLWIDDKALRELLSYDMNCLVVIVEKVMSYLMGYFSIIYLMAIFGIQQNKFWKKLVIIVPSAFTTLILLSGLFTEFFYYFDRNGEIVYFFPNNILVNIGIVLYLIFAVIFLATDIIFHWTGFIMPIQSGHFMEMLESGEIIGPLAMLFIEVTSCFVTMQLIISSLKLKYLRRVAREA